VVLNCARKCQKERRAANDNYSNVVINRSVHGNDSEDVAVDKLRGVYSHTTQLNSTDPVEQRTAKSVVFFCL